MLISEGRRETEKLVNAKSLSAQVIVPACKPLSTIRSASMRLKKISNKLIDEVQNSLQFTLGVYEIVTPNLPQLKVIINNMYSSKPPAIPPLLCLQEFAPPIPPHRMIATIIKSEALVAQKMIWKNCRSVHECGDHCVASLRDKEEFWNACVFIFNCIFFQFFNNNN